MLEVCFGDSVKGALTVAQHGGLSIIGSGVAVVTEKKGLAGWLQRRRAKQEYLRRQEELDRQAVPLGGTCEDIAALSFGFSPRTPARWASLSAMHWCGKTCSSTTFSSPAVSSISSTGAS